MKLRKATAPDASSLAAISIEVWLGTYLRRGVNRFFADYALAEFTADRQAALIRDPKERIMVSENDDGIDGFIRVTSGIKGPVAGCSSTEISTLYVQPRHHRKGIGQALLGDTIQHCRETNVASVWLTTNSENAPALGFYHALGFQTVGQTHFRIQDQGYLNDVLTCSLDAYHC